MPVVSSFYGIIILLYFNDHNPPHIHVKYAGIEALIEIRTGILLKGILPKRAIRLVQEWLEIYQEEINWERASNGQTILPIDGLE